MPYKIEAQPLFGSPYTTLTGTSEQTIPANAAGVASGIYAASGVNSAFSLNLPAENALGQGEWRVKATGWLKAHGTSQTVKLGLQWQNPQATSPSYADVFTTVASGTLTAGTVYQWEVNAGFVGDNTTGTLSIISIPVVYLGAVVTITTLTTALAAVNFGTVSIAPNVSGSASSGTPTSTVQPAVAVQFALSVLNSVSDTVETVGIDSFYAVID